MRRDRGERSVARIAFATAVAVVAAFVASKVARDAIWLSTFPVTSLPLFVGSSAILSFPIAILTGRLMNRLGPARLMPAFNLASAVLMCAEWAAYSHAPRLVAVTVFFHISSVGAVLVSGFWSIVNERFDAHTARRYISRICVGATLGGLLGGVVSERAAAYFTLDVLILVVVVLQVAAAAALFTLGPPPPRPEVDRRIPARPPVSAAKLVAASRLLRNLSLVVTLGAVAAAILDYTLKSEVAASHGDTVRILAIYYAVTNVLTALVQIGVGRRVLTRLGVPRTVATLPAAVAAFSLFALAVPTLLAAAIARGTEAVVRSSIYRSAYELLYAPLPERHKRPSKVVLDIAAERLGDLFGSQLIALIVYFVARPRDDLLLLAAGIAVLATMFALRLPRGYVEALEQSLLGQPALAPVLLDKVLAMAPPRAPRRSSLISRAATLRRIADLRSADPNRVRRALAGGPLTRELAPHVIPLLGWNEVTTEASAALAVIAPSCTGQLVDAFLDRTSDVAVRRRLPDLIAAGAPILAAWGLWRGLAEPSFDVRYRCGKALALLDGRELRPRFSMDEVFGALRREILIDRTNATTENVLRAVWCIRSGARIEHLFTLLGLAFPRAPLRQALDAIRTRDPVLRGTALEYLETLVPADVRAHIWPLLDVALDEEPSPPRARRHPWRR